MIRQALLSDAAAIATSLMLPLEKILYKFMGKKDYEEAYQLLLYFVKRENNQYSYQNCIVAEHEGNVVAALNYYDGGKLIVLRQPVLDYVRGHYNPDFNPEDETQPGEYYIDSLGVNTIVQGKGIGSQLLQFLIDRYVVGQQETIGLLVDDKNPDAKRLYLKLGFKSAGRKTLLGHQMEHLQVQPTA